MAKKLKIAIALTYLGLKPSPNLSDKEESKLTNCMALIDMTGNILFEYAKVHICNFQGGYEKQLVAGEQFYVAPLTYLESNQVQQVNIGVMICFDREFPESARALIKQGAEIILTSNSCPIHNDPILGDVRLQQFRTRAFENIVGVALTVRMPDSFLFFGKKHNASPNDFLIPQLR